MSISDTISWPKDFQELKKLDILLRCGICYDYMKTSMMTSCYHNYCSLCIRKYMQYKSVCPTCFEETYEINLRNNRTLDEIVLLFTTVRDKILRHLRLAAIHMPKTDEVDGSCITPSVTKISNEANTKVSISNEKTVARRLDCKEVVKSIEDCMTGITVLTSPTIGQSPKTTSSGQTTPVTKIPSIFYSPKKAVFSASPGTSSAIPTVMCPVCNVGIPERNINVHLDNCLARENSPSKCKPKSIKRDPIPKRVYSLMTDKDLRKWLRIYGLNPMGEKKILINRLQRYTVLYNSECDSENPREINEIIRQVEKEEKDEKSALNGFGVVRKQVNRNTDPKVIEEENKKYLEKNKATFENLIKTMRERNHKNIKPKRFINRIESDSDEEDFYCYEATEPISNVETSSACKFDCNDKNLQNVLEPDLTVHEDAHCSNTFDIRPESGLNKSNENVKLNLQNLDDICCSETHFNSENCISLSSEKMKDTFKSHNDFVELTHTQVRENEYKNEIVCGQLDSNSSNESFSLLINDVQNNVEGRSVFPKPSKPPLVLKSQITDPDYIVTDSEITLSEDSEDVFIKRSKRRRKSPDSILPKRVLRKRTKE